jgi:hypothetical protein
MAQVSEREAPPTDRLVVLSRVAKRTICCPQAVMDVRKCFDARFERGQAKSLPFSYAIRPRCFVSKMERRKYQLAAHTYELR